ncbi:AAA family ATPase [bacterium]|nr:AAA family ATPase [bacterium]
MRVISVVNQKGGCGKTTTAVNLSDCIALHHRKVLLIDLDPQSNATLAVGMNDNEIKSSMYDVFCNNMSVRDIVQEIYPNFFFAPSRVTLTAVEQFLSGKEGRETVLKECLQPVMNDFDYIIIDCPPSIGLLTFNALKASTEAIIPVEMCTFSMQGLGRLLGTLELMEERGGHVVSFRALATIFDQRTKFSWEFFDELKRHFGDKLRDTKIHETVKLKEAARAGKPISRYYTGCIGFFDYDKLAKEIIAEEPEKKEKKSEQKKPKDKGIRFDCFAPDAQSVQLVGDFNNWCPNQIHMLNSDGNGIWTKTLLLDKGKYQYRYIIDGQWIHDQRNKKTEYSPYGGLNSVIEI